MVVKKKGYEYDDGHTSGKRGSYYDGLLDMWVGGFGHVWW